MPSYAWLEDTVLDTRIARQKLAAMQKLGVPYTIEQIDAAESDQREQAEVIAADLAHQGVSVDWNREIVAVIAYLQRLGRDEGVKFTPSSAPMSSAGSR
jgi:cytochrome c oxidase cbb3-type subunit I/II